MTANQFRKLALSLPEVAESAHMGHPDFRVGGKIFATLAPDKSWGMVKLPPEQQRLLVNSEPDVFEPFNGAWGRQGSTKVILRAAKRETVRGALFSAWRNVAPKSLREEHEAE